MKKPVTYLLILVFLLFCNFSVAGETRTFATKCKQDLFDRCVGIFAMTSGPQTSWSITPPDIVVTKEDFETEIERILRESKQISSLIKEGKDHGVELSFTGQSFIDLASYAKDNLRRVNGDSRLHPQLFDDSFLHVFPNTGNSDIHINLKGEKGAVEKFKKVLIGKFASLKTEVMINQVVKPGQWRLSPDELLTGVIRNSPIIGLENVLRILNAASRYELTIDVNLKTQMKAIIEGSTAAHSSKNLSISIFTEAKNIEYTKALLTDVDPKNILANVLGEEFKTLSMKELLKSSSLGKGIGATAGQLGITHVTHQTKENTYTSITNNPTRKPNLFISRMGKKGELARRGEGFYTMKGKDFEWDPGYGDYKIIFKVNPNARVGSDFFLFNNEVIFTNLSALEVDEVALTSKLRPLDLYKKTLRGKLDPETFRSIKEVQSELIFNEEERRALDNWALQVFSDARSITDINPHFLTLYFNLPIENENGKEAIHIAAKLVSDLSVKRDDGRLISILSIWLNGEHYNSYKEIITNYLEAPKFSNGFYLSENFDPFLRSKALNEKWLLNYIRQSSQLTNIIKFIEKRAQTNGTKELLTLISSKTPDSCHLLASQFL